MTRIGLTLLLMALGGCVVPVTDARKLFGGAADTPKLRVTRAVGPFGIFGSASAEAGGDFAGTVDASYDPDSGGFTLKGTVTNNPVPVIDANGRLITAMEPTRMADIAASVEKTQALKEIWLAGFKAAETVGGAALTSFLGKSAAAFPDTGGLPPGVDLATVLNALKVVQPVIANP